MDCPRCTNGCVLPDKISIPVILKNGETKHISNLDGWRCDNCDFVELTYASEVEVDCRYNELNKTI